MENLFLKCVFPSDFQLVVGSFPSYADSDIGASFCGCDCSQFRIKHLFQYLKVIVIAIAGASAVVIGKDIGSNDEEKVRCNWNGETFIA